MKRVRASLTLATDVIVLAARRRVLWLYLAGATLLVLGLVLGTAIAGDDQSGFRLVMFGAETGVGVRESGAVARPAILFGLYLQVLVTAGMGFFGVALGLVAMSDAVSSAFEPGKAELILPRAVSRAEVVLARYAGGVVFAGLLAGWTCLLTVVLSGLRFGEWIPSFLLVAPALLLKFAILLAVLSLAAVVTRTRTLGLVAAGAVWLVSYAVNLAQLGAAHEGSLMPAALSGAARWAQRIVPQVGHQNELASLACQQPVGVPGFEPLTVVVQGVVWIAIALALTVWTVSRRDL